MRGTRAHGCELDIRSVQTPRERFRPGSQRPASVPATPLCLRQRAREERPPSARCESGHHLVLPSSSAARHQIGSAAQASHRTSWRGGRASLGATVGIRGSACGENVIHRVLDVGERLFNVAVEPVAEFLETRHRPMTPRQGPQLFAAPQSLRRGARHKPGPTPHRARCRQRSPKSARQSEAPTDARVPEEEHQIPCLTSLDSSSVCYGTMRGGGSVSGPPSRMLVCPVMRL